MERRTRSLTEIEEERFGRITLPRELTDDDWAWLKPQLELAEIKYRDPSLPDVSWIEMETIGTPPWPLWVVTSFAAAGIIAMLIYMVGALT